jgi:hypothetical protein
MHRKAGVRGNREKIQYEKLVTIFGGQRGSFIRRGFGLGSVSARRPRRRARRLARGASLLARAHWCNRVGSFKSPPALLGYD